MAADEGGGRPTPRLDERLAACRRSIGPFAVVAIAAFALQPFVGFLAVNRGQINDYWRLLIYAAFTTAMGMLAVAVVAWLQPRVDSRQVAAGAAVFIASFFSFSLLMGDAPQSHEEVLQVAVWGAGTTALVTLVLKLASYEWFRSAFVVFGVVYLAVPTVDHLAGLSSGIPEETPGETRGAPPDPAEYSPNVYWFVLDEYGRNDQLESVVGFENEPFYAELRSRGFLVSESSTANYPRTHLSLSSTLQMDYVAEPGNEIEDEFAVLSPILKGDNNTVRRFRDHGYDFVHSDYGSYQWLSCDGSMADVCLPANRPPRSIDEVDQALLELTPLRYLRVFGVPFTEPVQVLDELSAHQGEYESPFFLFAHIGSPHFPYRYERSCVARDVPRDAHQLDPEDRVTAYVQDARCLNALVIGAVDRILESDPDAIIVLQSDHGSNFLLDWALPLDEWSDAALQERYSVLNAVHLPDRCEGEIEGVSLVNTFRIVFACIEGLDEPDLLVDRHFLSPYDQVSGVVEIPPERIQEPG